MRLALGENRDQHVRAGHLLTARGLDVERGALDDALEAVGRLGLLLRLDDEIFELGVEILDDGLAQPVEVDAAGPRTAAASTSSISASRRCSRVAYS